MLLLIFLILLGMGDLSGNDFTGAGWGECSLAALQDKLGLLLPSLK